MIRVFIFLDETLPLVEQADTARYDEKEYDLTTSRSQTCFSAY